MGERIILRTLARILIPFILLFALYVQFHGDYGPGGGFQAGVIFGAAFILYALVFGLRKLQQLLSYRLIEMLAAVGLLLYAGTGAASLTLGGYFLEYNVLLQTPTHGQHLGILLIELGVGITVATAIVAIFMAFASRNRQ